MFIYSVTISIDKDVEKEWLEWMKNTHIKDVMNTNNFTDYKIYKIYSAFHGDDPAYSIQYFFNTIEDIENYQKNAASKLQKEHSDKYTGKYTATRTILKKID